MLNSKMINFDLDQAKLKQFYPGKDHTYAYRQIGFFLKKNDFEHIQGSGYVSRDPMSIEQVVKIIGCLSKKYTWLGKCIKDITATDVVINYNLTSAVIKAAEIAEKQSLQQAEKKKDKHFQR